MYNAICAFLLVIASPFLLALSFGRKYKVLLSNELGNSRISSENSRISSENSQNQVLDKLNVVDKLNSDSLNTKIDEQREGKNV